MTHASKHNTGSATQGAEAISIRQRSGIWSVSVNGKFYGDYTRRHWAIEAAVEKADDLAARGGAAVVTIEGQQNAMLYDTRRPASAPGEKDWLEQFAKTFQWRLWPARKKRARPPARVTAEQVPRGTRERKANYRSLRVPETLRSPV